MKFKRVAALAATMTIAGSAAFAATSDHAFKPVNAEMKGDDLTVVVRLTNKVTGKPVTDAVIIRTRVDMARDGMAKMESPVSPLPAKEPGVYAFKTDLPMAGRLPAQPLRQSAGRGGNRHRQGCAAKAPAFQGKNDV
jgi:hypothetical protein